MDEKAEREDSGSGEYDCDCVIEEPRVVGGTSEWVCAAGNLGERERQKQLRVDIMQFFVNGNFYSLC